MREKIMSIYDRIINNQESTISINNKSLSGASWMTSLSKVSTLGGLIKEIQQERNLKKLEESTNNWEYQALKLNQKYFSDKRTK